MLVLNNAFFLLFWFLNRLLHIIHAEFLKYFLSLLRNLYVLSRPSWFFAILLQGRAFLIDIFRLLFHFILLRHYLLLLSYFLLSVCLLAIFFMAGVRSFMFDGLLFDVFIVFCIFFDVKISDVFLIFIELFVGCLECDFQLIMFLGERGEKLEICLKLA